MEVRVGEMGRSVMAGKGKALISVAGGLVEIGIVALSGVSARCVAVEMGAVWQAASSKTIQPVSPVIIDRCGFIIAFSRDFYSDNRKMISLILCSYRIMNHQADFH